MAHACCPLNYKNLSFPMNPDAIAAQSLSSDISAPWREDVTAQLHATMRTCWQPFRLTWTRDCILFRACWYSPTSGCSAALVPMPMAAMALCGGFGIGAPRPRGCRAFEPGECAHGLLATWRFTLGQNLHAMRLVEQFHAQLESHVSGKPLVQALHNMLPQLQGAAGAGPGRMPHLCQGPAHAPQHLDAAAPVAFCQALPGQLLLGFVLMLLGTAASQVPPYLTIPLVMRC
jgi:hypothetical protein